MSVTCFNGKSEIGHQNMRMKREAQVTVLEMPIIEPMDVIDDLVLATAVIKRQK